MLVRVDFNIPIEQGIEAIAGYDQRLRATLPTIRHLIDKGCRTILCSHLGRPRGKVDDALRLGPVGDRLAFLLGHPVKSLPEVTGPEVEAAVAEMSAGDVVLLENLRFDAGEEANDPEFAKSLAALADYFVMDAFAVAHRAHASTVGVTEYLPSAMGFLVEKEVNSMGRALESPEKPLAALMGGAKVSDKILLLENILDKLDHLFIGGGMCVTFLKAQGHGIGASQVEEDRLEFAREMLGEAEKRGIKVHLPSEVVVASEFAADPSEVQVTSADGVPEGGDHHGHRAVGGRRFCQRAAGVPDGHLERADGRVRDAEVQRRNEGGGERHRGGAGGYERGRRRVDGGDRGGAGADGSDDARVDRRRCVAGVPGRNRTAGDRGTAGRVAGQEPWRHGKASVIFHPYPDPLPQRRGIGRKSAEYGGHYDRY